MTLPEEQARQSIDRLLAAAGWAVQDVKGADIHAARGVAIREFPLNPGNGCADYLLYVDGKAAGVIEAKKQGATLTGVEVQSARYAQGLPASLPAHRRPAEFVDRVLELGPKLFGGGGVAICVYGADSKRCHSYQHGVGKITPEGCRLG